MFIEKRFLPFFGFFCNLLVPREAHKLKNQFKSFIQQQQFNWVALIYTDRIF